MKKQWEKPEIKLIVIQSGTNPYIGENDTFYNDSPS
jgi:hypothetical protein